MSAIAVKSELSASIIEKVLVIGDLSKLTSAERLSYYSRVCDSVGLNPLTRPFEYITLNGKLVLYARRDATDQLRSVHKISVTISAREMIGDVYVVTAKARNSEGREDESTGAVFTASAKGENLANAMMKAETKAKRRVTLSICGLGLLDETEVESIPREAFESSASEPASSVIQIQAAKSGASSYCPTFGKYKGQKLGDLDVAELANYVGWLEEGFQNSGKPISPPVAEFLDKTHQLITERQALYQPEGAM